MRRTTSLPTIDSPLTRRGLLASGAALALTHGRARAAAGPTPGPDDATGGYAHPDWLVEPGWLANRLGDPTVMVVALAPADEFTAGHIQGAAQVDWTAFEIADTSDPSIARWQAEVEATLTRLAISPADTVVVYDGGTLFAARLWWILDLLGHADKRILNGGLAAWRESGGAVEQGAATVEPAGEPYAGHRNPAALATLGRVVASLEDPMVVLLDARAPEEYADGHIPGAVNVNYPLNAAPEPPKVWKPAGELRDMYAARGVTSDTTVIPYCATGVRSAVTYFTLRLIGYPDVALFTGSWAEWSAHPELPVAVEDQG